MIRSECNTCLSWDARKDMCLRVAHGMSCVVGPMSPKPSAAEPPRCAPPPSKNRFMAWDHENLANFARDVFEENVRLRETLAKIQVVLGA